MIDRYRWSQIEKNITSVLIPLFLELGYKMLKSKTIWKVYTYLSIKY